MLKKDENGDYKFTRRFWVQACIGGLLIVLVGLSTQRTANQTERLTAETREYSERTNECLTQVLVALDQRGEITTENDLLSQEQRALLARANDAQNRWIAEILNPSVPDVAARDINDPVREEYNLKVTRFYFTDIADIADQVKVSLSKQEDLIVKRSEHPYPKPNCTFVAPLK